MPFSSSQRAELPATRRRFGGNADGVGLDVNGTIGKLAFKRGLGNPNGVFTGEATSLERVTGQLLPATTYGTPEGSTGYPAAGDLGGTDHAPRASSKLTIKAGQCARCRRHRTRDIVQLEVQGYPTYVRARRARR